MKAAGGQGTEAPYPIAGPTVEGCNSAVVAYIAALKGAGLTVAAIDAALADLAVTLGEASQTGASAEIAAAALLQVRGDQRP